jgi:hypothetical protein
MLRAIDIQLFSLLQHAIPAPLARFEASNILTGAGGGVTGWRNVGIAGSPLDLALPAGNAAPQLVPGAGSAGGDALRFRGGDFLQTLSDLPLAGGSDRLLLARLKLESGGPAYRNLFGYGSPQIGQLSDMTLTDADQVLLHQYYQATETVPTPVPRGQWVTVGYVINTPPATEAYRQYALLNDVLGKRSATGQGSIMTMATPLRVGAGGFDSWNQTNHVFLLDALSVYATVTDKQVTQIVHALLP